MTDPTGCFVGRTRGRRRRKRFFGAARICLEGVSGSARDRYQRGQPYRVRQKADETTGAALSSEGRIGNSSGKQHGSRRER